MPEFASALELFFGDTLTGDDVFDGHEVILIQNPSPASPMGEELTPSLNGKSSYPSRNKPPSHLGRARG
jgi:hypothetical protein